MVPRELTWKCTRCLPLSSWQLALQSLLSYRIPSEKPSPPLSLVFFQLSSPKRPNQKLLLQNYPLFFSKTPPQKLTSQKNISSLQPYPPSLSHTLLFWKGTPPLQMQLASHTSLQLLSCSSTETYLLSNGQNISMPRVKLSLAHQFHYLTLWPPTTRRHVAPWDCDTCPKLAAENEPQMGVYKYAPLR